MLRFFDLEWITRWCFKEAVWDEGTLFGIFFISLIAFFNSLFLLSYYEEFSCPLSVFLVPLINFLVVNPAILSSLLPISIFNDCLEVDWLLLLLLFQYWIEFGSCSDMWLFYIFYIGLDLFCRGFVGGCIIYDDFCITNDKYLFKSSIITVKLMIRIINIFMISFFHSHFHLSIGFIWVWADICDGGLDGSYRVCGLVLSFLLWRFFCFCSGLAQKSIFIFALILYMLNIYQFSFNILVFPLFFVTFVLKINLLECYIHLE